MEEERSEARENRVQVFLSTVRDDRAIHNEFMKHLHVLTRHEIAIADDLDRADVILLLVTPSYLSASVEPDSEAEQAWRHLPPKNW